MPLQEQIVSVGLAQGLDTKQDPKTLALGKLVDLQNAIFVKPGQLRKRNGYASKTTSVFGGGSVSSGNALFTLGNQIMLHDGTALYTYDLASQTWRNLTSVTAASSLVAPGAAAVSVKTTPIIRYGFAPGHPDMTVHPNGFTCVAWENVTNGGVFFSLIGTATGASLVAGSAVPVITTAADMRSPKVMSIGNLILIFVVNGTSLYVHKIDTTNVAAGLSAPSLVNSTLSSQKFGKNYDAAVIGSNVIVTYSSNTNSLNTSTIDGSFTITPRNSFSITAPSTCVTIFRDYVPGQYVVAWSTATTGTNFKVYGAGFNTVIVAPTQIEATTAVTITGVSTGARNYFLYTIAPTNQSLSQNFSIRIRTYTNYGADALPSVFARSVGLGGKAFVINAQMYVPAIYESLVQPCVFILDQSGQVVGKALYGASGGQLVGASNTSGTTQLPEANISGLNAIFAATEVVSLGVNGIKSITATIGGKVTGASQAGSLHFGAGIMWMYDGVSVVEHNFHLAPEVVTVPNPGGKRIYQYAQCFEWTDAQGCLHRSAPSIPVTQAQTNAIDPASNAVTVTMTTLRLTRKPNAAGVPTPGSPVQCVLYRTIDTGTVFYRVHAVNQTPPLNDPTVDTITFTDGVPDTTIRANPILYTQGAGGAGTGRLDSLPANPPKFIAMIRNRIWYIDAENPLSLGYSQEVGPLQSVEFSGIGDGSLSFNLEARGGSAVALANLDDKVVVFRQNTMSYIFGDGPAPDGSQNDFREIPIPANVGCSDPASIVSSDVGLIFKTSKGFFQLDRSLQTSYVGASVEAYNQHTVTSSVQLPGSNWLLFTMSNGQCLLYDYLMNQWSVFTNLSAVDSAVYGGVHTWLGSNGVVHQETPAVYNDDGVYIPLVAKLAWAKLGGISGFQRVWELEFLGDWLSAHSLRIDLAYDYDGDTIVQSSTYDAPTSLVPYQFRVQCQKQQCEAIQVTLTEVPLALTVDQGLTFTAVSFSIGVKKGLFKLPAAQSKG